MFHYEKPAPTGVILLQQPEAGGLEQLLPLAFTMGQAELGVVGLLPASEKECGHSSCLLVHLSAAGAPLGSVLATMCSPPGNRWSSKPSAAG